MSGRSAAEMVEKQLRRRGIRDQRVLNAMLIINREDFVGPDHRKQAYADAPLSIGYGQTITQPYMTALMAQCLALKGTEKVLDVGTGSGYHAAVLGSLARRVISIERIPELADRARENGEHPGRLRRRFARVCEGESLRCDLGRRRLALGAACVARTVERPGCAGDSRRQPPGAGPARPAEGKRENHHARRFRLPVRAAGRPRRVGGTSGGN